MSTSKTITVTLSPSLDRTLVIHYLGVGYHNRVKEPTRLDPSGHGVNITRALHNLACPTQAVVVLGDDADGSAYKALIEEEVFDTSIITVKGNTRSTTIILDTGNHTETQIVEERTEFNEDDLRLVTEALKYIIQPGDTVIFAGSPPENSPENIYAHLTTAVRESGARVVIKTRDGAALIAALEALPDLIVVGQMELEVIMNYPVRVMDTILDCTHKLREQGAGRVLITMREEERVVFTTDDSDWVAQLPESTEGTSSGVWDAFLAGYIAGEGQQLEPEEALKLGAAAAAYTAAQVGNVFGSLEEIAPFKDQIEVAPAKAS